MSPTPSPLRVAVIEADQDVAARLRALLAEHPDHVCVQAGALPVAGGRASADVSVIVVASGMGPSRVPRCDRGVPVVIFTEQDDEIEVLEALSAGATGYLLADISSAELVAALKRAANGQTVVDLGIGGRIASQLADTRAARTALVGAADLRPRERQVLESLLEGRTNREIARNLNLGEETVKTHLGSLYRKLGARDRSQAIAITLRQRHR